MGASFRALALGDPCHRSLPANRTRVRVTAVVKFERSCVSVRGDCRSRSFNGFTTLLLDGLCGSIVHNFDADRIEIRAADCTVILAVRLYVN